MPWDVSLLREAVDGARAFGRPDELRMDARIYAEVRKNFGKPELEIMVSQEDILNGTMAKLDGMAVRVLKPFLDGVLTVHGEGRCLYHTLRPMDLGMAHKAAGPPEECDLCLVREIMTR
jgi:hypothetical protein